MKTTIVGIDCATDVSKIGIALGEIEEGKKPKLWEAQVGQRGGNMSEMIIEWTRAIGGVLLAMDAPLGWPAAMSRVLPEHEAGAPIDLPPNQLFRRHTDRAVKKLVGRQPLDVGADRIARTAHAALELLKELRAKTGFPIRLAWRPQLDQVISAIEVYPAATLQSRGLPASGYKRKADQAKREELVVQLSEHIELPADPDTLVDEADAFDAALCVLGAADFVRGWCAPPDDLEIARKEGWIWVKPNEPDEAASADDNADKS